MQHCEEAQKLAEDLGEDLKLAHALRNLANVKRDQKEHQEAASLYKRSLNIFRGANDRLGIARTLSEYAWCAHLMNELTKSRSLAEESIQFKERFHFNNELAATYHTLFEITQREVGPSASYAIIEKVYDLSSKYHDGYILFDALHHLVALENQRRK